MPTADGRFLGISIPCLPWLEAEAEDLERAICGCGDGPCDLCVESDGKCQRGDQCRCKNGETTAPGW